MNDWSTLLTYLLKDLREAEENFRLIHMHESYVREARVALLKAQEDLNDLISWTDTR